MKYIKLALLSFFFLFLLVTAISLFIPSQIQVSKAINVNASADSVYRHISAIREWRNWHPELKTIPENEFTYQDNGSMQVKENNLVILKREKDEVFAEFRKGKSKPVKSGIKLISYQHTDSVTIQWYMNFRLPWYPWEKFKSLFYENIYGVQMEQGLANLKKLLETGRLSNN